MGSTSTTWGDNFDSTFSSSPRRKSFEMLWHGSVDQYWERMLGHVCTAAELHREDMVAHYHTTTKPRLLLDIVNREVVRGTDLKKIKYLVISHGWPQNASIRGVILNGMYWEQDCIDERALDCLIKDAESLGFRYVWVDALCTPQKYDFDIEDTNRMGQYYTECASCLVYLDKIGVDVTPEDVANGNLPWFSRYWTLQEAWLPTQCLFKLARNNETVFATDYNFFWLIAASPRLGESEALQSGYELLGKSWRPTLANIDRHLAGRTGYNELAAIYSILHLASPLFRNRNVQAPRQTDVAALARWFVAQLEDPSHLVNCPTILALFGGSREYAWLRRAPALPIYTCESDSIEVDVIWPNDPRNPLGLRQSREYVRPSTAYKISDLWDYKVARTMMRAMVRPSGGGNRLCQGLWPKLEKFLEADGPSGHTIETNLDGFVPERLGLVSTHKRWSGDNMVVVRELVLVKGNDDPELYHCTGWRESILEDVPYYRKQTIFVGEAVEG
ncbi:hypothetical protein BJ742DRAFT_774033 [Cladochytrium replicatum]|nr:hypothetical protein BJ742DRAFT_774033 [Cladochytrium replicatum]